MEIMIPLSGVFQFSASPAVKTTSTDSTPTPVSQPAAQVSLPTAATVTGSTGTTNAADTSNASQQEEDSARQAALSFKDVYAVSDTAVSVFKDVTGHYITRSVSLRDGTVTYSPEPQYVKPSASSSISIEA